MLRATPCVFAAFLLLTACATEPWHQEPIRNSAVVSGPRERVWAWIVKSSPGAGLNVTNVDRTNGIISAEMSVPPWDGGGDIRDWAVCGAGGLLKRPLSQHADLNIVVVPEGAGTRVTINSRFTELRQNKTTRSIERVRCTSVGTLEQQLLDLYFRY